MRCLTDLARLRAFMARLAENTRRPTTVYFTGGATALLAAGLVTPEGIRAEWARVRDDLYRYPAIDPASLAASIEQALEGPGKDPGA